MMHIESYRCGEGAQWPRQGAHSVDIEVYNAMLLTEFKAGQNETAKVLQRPTIVAATLGGRQEV